MFHVKFINKKRVIYSDIIPEVEHFFTTREFVIRSDENRLSTIVEENKQDICKYLNIPTKLLLSPVQTHSGNVKIANSKIETYQNTDGLIVDNSDIGVYLNYADCTPIILYDKKHNVGAVLHAGWKGTVAQISTNAINIMKKEYLTNLEDVYAIIGPTIAICCYCVGEDVFNQLKNTVSNIEPYSTSIYDKIYVDLKGINKQQLIDIGVPNHNIDVCPYCTSCNNDMFFSYRKENGTTSRHSAVLKLKNI